MRATNRLKRIQLLIALVFLAACQPPDFSKLAETPASLLKISKKSTSEKHALSSSANKNSAMQLGDILDGSLATKNQGSDFISTLQYALDTDPKIIAARRDIEAKIAVVGVNKAQKDFQVGTTQMLADLSKLLSSFLQPLL